MYECMYNMNIIELNCIKCNQYNERELNERFQSDALHVPFHQIKLL